MEEEVVLVIVIFPSGSVAYKLFFVFCERFLSLFPSLFMAILYHKGYPILFRSPKSFLPFSKSFLAVDDTMLVRCSELMVVVER